ncbi:unnamed protein product, partial [Discosporangium mesarthrocarpum]
LERWSAAAARLGEEERLAEDAKKVLAADIMTSLRRLIDDINEDDWMFDPPNLG